jgi:galactose mutarotase-like enzyme
MRHHLRPQPGYPFSLALSVEYLLSEDGLRVRTTTRNAGADRCPFGSGAHPYLTAGIAVVEDTVLHAPARAVLRTDRRGIPIGVESVEGTEYDFRGPRPIGPTRLDHCFTDLERDPDALRTGVGLITLEPGGSCVSEWGISPQPYNGERGTP